MKFICYTSWDQLPESANALFEQAEKVSIFYSRPWFENLIPVVLEDDQTMLLACVVAQGKGQDKVMAILPLIKSTTNNAYSLKHRYSTHYNLLLADDDQQSVLECLARGLSELPLHSLLLEPVADNDHTLLAFQRNMEMAGYSCEYIFRFYNWIYRVQGQTFEDYMAARPAKLRNTIARKKRKLEREHGYEIRLFTGEEVPPAMPDYYAVYTASWKANEQYVDFVDSVVDKLSRAGTCGPGWTRLAILYVKDQPVAAQLWFVLHAKASIFRLSYDEAWKTYSPGSILTRFLMEYVIDVDKVEEIDFLSGNDAYKQDWMSERRERFALSCINQIKPVSRYQKIIESLKKLF